jgi:hypothetical protein
MQAPAKRRFKPPRSLGAVATVAVIVIGFVGFAVWFQLRPETEPELHDEAGIVESWSFGPADRAPRPLELREAAVVAVNAMHLGVYWYARPCATGPEITVTGTPANVLVAVDRRDTGACDDSAVVYRVLLETTVPVEPDAVTATVTA